MKDIQDFPIVIGRKYFCAHKILGTVQDVRTIRNGKGENIHVAVGVREDGSPWQSRYPSRELPPITK